MANCATCGVTIPAGQEVVLQGRSGQAPHVVVCQSCANRLGKALQAETEDVNTPGGLLLGLCAALASAMSWYLVSINIQAQFGILAVGVGWLVAQAVMFGAGRKRGQALQIISLVIALLAMVLSRYLVLREYAMRELGDLPLFLPLDTMAYLLFDSLKTNPLTLLFWAIAMWEAFILPAPRRLRPRDSRSS